MISLFLNMLRCRMWNIDFFLGFIQVMNASDGCVDNSEYNKGRGIHVDGENGWVRP